MDCKLKKNIFLFIFFSFATLAFGFIISKVVIHDAKNISEAYINCGKQSAYRIISENYIENLLTTNVVVRDKRQQVVDGQNQSVVYTDAYTLFGIKLATITSLCNSKTKEILCAAPVYKIWSKIKADSNNPCG